MEIELERKRSWRSHRKQPVQVTETDGVSDKDLFCACAVAGSIVGMVIVIAIAMWRAL